MKFEKGLLDIFLLAVLWGPSPLFIKIAINDITPLTLVLLRISLSGVLLFSIIKYKNILLSQYRYIWKHCFILGIFANGLPFISFNYSLQYIPSSLCALINGSTPLLTIILASIFLKEERLTPIRQLGVVIGLFGFLILFLPAIINNDLEYELKWTMLSLLASASYAIGMVYARKNLKGEPPLVIATLQLLTSLTYLIPIAFLFESPITIVKGTSFPAWIGVFGLTIFGTVLAFIIYNRIMKTQGATALSMVTYLLPVIGTLLGIIFLKETISLQFCISAILIIYGLLIVNSASLLPRRIQIHKVFLNK